MQNIIIGSDHGGFDLKEFFKQYLTNEGYSIIDVGTTTSSSCDYPDIAEKLALKIKELPESLGILICGTGVGMSIAINKYSFIRGALLYSIKEAILAKEHNDANVIIFGARMFENKENLDFLNAFLTAEFTKEERHNRRIKKLSSITSKEN